MGASKGFPDLVSTFILTGLKGSCSRPKKLLENVCAAGASPVAGVPFSTFVRFHSLSRRILLLSLSMNLQQLNELCCWMEWLHKKKENGNHFFGVENSKKKSEERGQKWPGIQTRF